LSSLAVVDDIEWTDISTSDVIVRGKRLDASNYEIQAERAKKLLHDSNLELVPLTGKNGYVQDAFFPGRFKRHYANKGIPFLGSSEILQTNPTPIKFLSNEFHGTQQDLFVKENYILVSRSGTIGKIVFSTKYFENIALSDHIIRLVPKNFENAACLYVYLKSEIGQRILASGTFGSVVDEIDPKNFHNVPIPIFPKKFQNEITNTVKEIIRLRYQAIELFKKADSLFYEKLHLKRLQNINEKFIDSENLSFILPQMTAITEVGHSRLDASYHVPIIQNIFSELNKLKVPLVNIGDKRISEQLILPGRFKRNYVGKTHGIPFLSSKQIRNFDLSDVKFLSKEFHSARISKELTLDENMILISSSGTIGNVVLAPEYFKNWTASQHVVRIIPSPDMNPGFLYAYLTSEYGYELLTRYTFGSVVDEIYDTHVADIPIPLPSKQIINLIGNPVLEANRKINTAFKMEQNIIKNTELQIKNQNDH